MRRPARAVGRVVLRPVPVAMMTAAALAATAIACTPPSSDPPDLSTTTTVDSAPTTAAATTTTTTIPATTTTLPNGTALYSPTPVNGWGILKEGVGDQYVDAVEIAGNAAFAGGLFTHAVKDSQTANRANLMSVDLSTGNLRSFVADTNGSVNALASDGAALYLGGTFTTVNGVPRSRIAKVDLTTGAVDPTFVADVGALVDDMVVVGGTLYVGGEFNTVDGVTRHHVAAVRTGDGSLVAAFDPNTDGKISALASSPDGSVLYLGGNFTTVGTTSRTYLAKVNATTGAVLSPTFSKVGDVILDLSVSSDGASVYGAGGGGFNSAAGWSATTGKRYFAIRADGDTQAVQYSNSHVYMGFHDGITLNGIRSYTLRVLALDPSTGVPDPAFMPESNSYPGVYCLDADGRYLVAGGYFSNMGGVGVKGLAIFPKA